jgi:hypothetical protein
MIGFLGGAILASFLPDIAVLNSVRIYPGHRSYRRQEAIEGLFCMLSDTRFESVLASCLELDALRGVHD